MAESGSGLDLARRSRNAQTFMVAQKGAVHWRQTLSRLKEACQADAAWVVQYDTETRRGRILFAINVAAEAAEAYRHRFSQIDPWLENEFCFQDVGMTVSGHDVLPDATLEQTEFYRGWLKPQGLFHHSFGVLSRSDSLVMLLVLARKRMRNHFGATEATILGAVLPACAANWRLDGLLQASRAETRAVWSAMDHLNCGIVLTDPGGRVFGLNQVAREILQQQDGLSLQDGFLAAMRHPDHLRLHGALRRLSDSAADPTAISAFTIPHEEGDGGLNVILKWIVDPRSANGPAASIIVAFLCDPRRARIAPPDLLTTLFGLTRVEAEVALLLSDGFSVNDVADRLRTSKHTVRTYLKSIFQKTGTHRQATLVRLILMGAGAVRPTPKAEPCARESAHSKVDGVEPAGSPTYLSN